MAKITKMTYVQFWSNRLRHALEQARAVKRDVALMQRSDWMLVGVIAMGFTASFWAGFLVHVLLQRL